MKRTTALATASAIGLGVGLAAAWLRYRRLVQENAALRARERAAGEQARLREAIANAAREWQLTFDAVESVLLMVDGEGRVRRMNRAASQLAGKPFRELLGLRVEELGRGEPWATAAALVVEVAGSRASRSGSAVDPASGTTWDLSASFSTSAGEDHVIVVAREVTGLVRLQESLRRSEVMSAMGSLVAGVAHEVRNPLFGISAALDAFESRFGGREEYGQYLYVLRSQLARLNRLMNQLLDYGKPPRLEVGAESLSEVVAEAVANCSSLAGRQQVEIQPRLAPGLPPVPMDRQRMLQVLQNLLENAIQHSPAPGVVEVEGGLDSGSEPPAVVFTVRDSGPGFRPEDLPRVFEPFFTRRKDGTGLGLSIVHRIVEQHGGAIRAGNRDGGGGELLLRLPLSELAAAAPAAPGR